MQEVYDHLSNDPRDRTSNPGRVLCLQYDLSTRDVSMSRRAAGPCGAAPMTQRGGLSECSAEADPVADVRAGPAVTARGPWAVAALVLVAALGPSSRFGAAHAEARLMRSTT
jgi:hypothetical protein